MCVCTGKGGSGQVWLGDYEGRPVAIKVLTTLHTAMWKRETDIYQTHMLSHPNILAFITNEVYEKRRCGLSMGVVRLGWGQYWCDFGVGVVWLQAVAWGGPYEVGCKYILSVQLHR